ncbi:MULTISPECIES: roadblock/LC7 domain-containing protein [Actinomycetes]|uniref:roadblock/LC7 domain-containing protein n=1 Tax=Actinomycetes TaxID=1760 RepID=UPI00061F7104|nr:roadblock/LC7 domain-containing protein [Saccharothrix sp. ST-888]KJK55663.1 diacylglyceryl transferase [Saccharothrix sp. ST-888]
MISEHDVLIELRGLRARIPHLAGGLVATTDGLVVAHDTTDLEPEGIAALTAAALGVGARLTEATGRGGFRELLTRGEFGYTATYAVGAFVVLTLLAGPEANVGRLHLEARKAGARIAALADTALGRLPS